MTFIMLRYVSSILTLLRLKNIFIYLFLAALDLCCYAGFSLDMASRGYCSLQCMDFSCCGAQALACTGFSGCGMWVQQLWFPGSRGQAQQLCCLGLAVPQQVGSSQIRDRTHISYIGRQIFYQWATREAPSDSFYHEWMDVEFYQMLFLHLFRWSSGFHLIDLHILNHPCNSGMNTTWSWYMILFMYSWIQFANISLRIYATIFIKDTGL